jgi:di/tricarboxylate transporter
MLLHSNVNLSVLIVAPCMLCLHYHPVLIPCTGGMSTLTGTGANLILKATLQNTFKGFTIPSWGQYFVLAAPLCIVLAAVLWALLCSKYLHGPQHPIASLVTITDSTSAETNSDSSTTIATAAMTRQQKFVIGVASTMVALWILKDPPG